MQTTIEHWNEWCRVCAIARCGRETVQALHGFAWPRFRRFVAVATGDAAASQLAPPAPQAWHLLETYLATSRTRKGKLYKQWLFGRVPFSSDPPLDVIQGGATLLIRSVARAYVVAEMPHGGTVSLDRPIGRGTGGPTLFDLLPGAADESVEERDLHQAALPVAEEVFRALPRRHRVLDLAKRLGLSLCHPAVLTASGSRKTAAYAAWRSVFLAVAATVRQRFSGDASATQLRLALEAHARLGEKILLWAQAENDLQNLFFIAGREP